MSSDSASSVTLFISYASVNRPEVLELVGTLDQRGIRTWIDLDGIAAGESYGPEIVNGIRTAHAVLLMCTNASLASRNVRQEIQLAWRYDRPIVPVLLEQLAIPDDLAYWLEGAQWVDTTTLSGEQWIDRMLDALARRGIGSGSQRDAVARPTGVSVEPKGNLPADVRPSIGREQDLRRLLALIANSDLVTVTGPGGVGKSTLAVESARRVVHRFPDGAWFVDASAGQTAEHLSNEIAATLGVPTSPDVPTSEALLLFLRGKHLLLVLDNLEQIPDAGVALLPLLADDLGVSMLVTSRTPLHLPREAHFPLAGFESIAPGAVVSAASVANQPGIALFVERARDVRPDFTLTDGNASAIAAICNRLDGLPLAIEIVASRSRLLPPAAILDRMDSVLTVTGPGSLRRSARQQTLRSAIEWSFNLLDPNEQQVMTRLSVFVGGFEIDAAEAVCGSGDVVESLETLLDHHLLATIDAAVGESSPRLRLLETVRAFALELLEERGESGQANGRHKDYFANRVKTAEPALQHGADPMILNALAADHVNILRAFATAIDHADIAAAVSLTIGMLRFWLARGQLREGVGFVDDCLGYAQELTGADLASLYRTRAILLETSGNLYRARTDWQSAIEAATAAGDERLLASALSGLGTVSEAAGRYEDARTAYRAALAIQRSEGNQYGVASALHYLGSIETMIGNHDSANEYIQEAIRIWRSLGDLQPLSYSIQQAGILAFLDGDYDTAVARYEETLGIAETLSDQYSLGNVLLNLGSALEMGGAYEESVERLHRARTIFEAMGDTGGVGYVDYLIGHVARATGNPEAVSRLNQALRTLAEVGDLPSVALVHETLAGLAVDRGDPDGAANHFQVADSIRVETGAAVPGSRTAELARDRERCAKLQATRTTT